MLLRLAVVVCFLATLAGCGTPSGGPSGGVLTTLDGKKVQLSSFRGKVVLIDFWATWCLPCRESMPEKQKLYDKYKDKGLAVVAVSSEPTSDVVSFLNVNKYTLPAYIDADQSLFKSFGVTHLPTIAILDKSGALVAQTEGEGDPEWVVENLAKAGLKMR
jgi:thiol-disulfide isomerase/thioredoxin